jgi:hypothetical protein
MILQKIRHTKVTEGNILLRKIIYMIYLNTLFENLSICIRPVSQKMPFKIYEGLFKCFTKKINVLGRKY